MITIQGKIPRQVVVATSGGVDSMAVVNFLSRNHRVLMHFIDHGTETSKKALEFITDYADKHRDLGFISSEITAKKPVGESWEEFWRNERYGHLLNWHYPVITCHHLDDCIETWIWSSLNGEGKIIPYQRGNVIRPFRLTEKSTFVRWAEKNNVPWVEDESNKDTSFTRNYIRHELMPHALMVNPGLAKTIRKKVKADVPFET